MLLCCLSELGFVERQDPDLQDRKRKLKELLTQLDDKQQHLER